MLPGGEEEAELDLFGAESSQQRRIGDVLGLSVGMRRFQAAVAYRTGGTQRDTRVSVKGGLLSAQQSHHSPPLPLKKTNSRPGLSRFQLLQHPYITLLDLLLLITQINQ